MDSELTIIDISSDEEETFHVNNSGNASGSLSGNFRKIVSQEIDDNCLVGLHEFPSATNVQNYPDSAASQGRVDLSDHCDDDCVIVEKKPDIQVPIVHCDNFGGGDLDELLIIQETGELACRDYPHPRHLCAKFPFSTTPHQKHCSMCHCYVCDSPAPCIYWESGPSRIGHCHAHRDKWWSTERKSLKKRRTSSPEPKQDTSSSSITQINCSNSEFNQDHLSAIPTVSSSIPLEDGPKIECRALSITEKIYKEIPFAFSFRRLIPKPPAELLEHDTQLLNF